MRRARSWTSARTPASCGGRLLASPDVFTLEPIPSSANSGGLATAHIIPISMLIEEEAIPYDAARLLGERLLVLAPHPDDEVIGCGGLVAQHLRLGRAVRVIVATDGAEAQGGVEDREGYRAKREEESRRGLQLLGGNDIHFLRFADRALDDSVAAPIRKHLATFKPDLICVPSPIEIDPDHLALSRAFCNLV